MADKLAKILGMGVVLLIVFAVGEANAAVTGVCVNCHTMHNSQDGADMRLDGPPVAGTFSNECVDCHVQLRPNLLRMDCIGCHAENTTGPNISPTTNAPQVFYNESATELAAGNFSYVSGFVRDSYGHNVHGLGLANDGVLMNDPPGYFTNFDPSPGYNVVYPGSGYQQVMCAGTQGCHGDRTQLSQAAAVHGAHHADDSVLKFGTIDEATQGGTVGTSYRFLLNVKGGEDDDWHASSSKTDHNEYKGALISERAGQAYNDGTIETMSNFCAECHGDFHAASVSGALNAGDATAGIGGTGSSPWIRHPNDIALPAGSPWDAYTDYTVEVPIGRTTIPNSPDGLVSASTNGKIVMCLSCHKAHGSQYPDSLRFDYGLMLTGTTGSGQGTGCFRCHTLKDG